MPLSFSTGYIGLFAAIALLSGCGYALPLAQIQNPTDHTSQASVVVAQSFSDEAYASVLQTYVNSEGLVNYTDLQANPEQLNAFVQAIATLPPSTYQAWSEPEKIAFLINAYNALTLKSIISQKPLKRSIKDIFGVWNLQTHTVMGQAKTLDHIEHQILRREFNEPRIHAALVCAAISCPPLRQEPYTGTKLNAQLEDQVRQWLRSPHGLRLDRAHNRVEISSIFQWFGEDWQKTYSTEGQFTGNAKQRATLNFISTYLSPQERDYLSQGSYKLGYLDYDWSLNQQRSP